MATHLLDAPLEHCSKGVELHQDVMEAGEGEGMRLFGLTNAWACYLPDQVSVETPLLFS